MPATITQQVDSIRESAEEIRCDEREIIGTASPGDVVRQGDVYLVCLDSFPVGKRIENRQLAPGTTQGSRHILEGDCEIRECDKVEVANTINHLVRDANVRPELVGPVFRCLYEVDVTHPEHGDKCLPNDSVWATVYQRVHAKEVRRVID